LTIELSRVVMKVAIEITATIDQGLRLPATDRSGVQPSSPPGTSGLVLAIFNAP